MGQILRPSFDDSNHAIKGTHPLDVIGAQVYLAEDYNYLTILLADMREYNSSANANEAKITLITPIPSAYAGTLGDLNINLTNIQTRKVEDGTSYKDVTTGSYTIPSMEDLPVKLNVIGVKYLVHYEVDPKE